MARAPYAYQPRAYDATTTGAGCFAAPPGTPYLIDIALKQRIPRGGLRIVRASIDGREINEQVVLRSGSGTARFCGWLEDASGAKRIQFAFPPSGQTVIQVGVFEATEASKDGGGAGKLARRSIHLSIHLSIYLSIYLSIHLSVLSQARSTRPLPLLAAPPSRGRRCVT